MDIMDKGIPNEAKSRFQAALRSGFGTRKTYSQVPASEINVLKD